MHKPYALKTVAAFFVVFMLVLTTTMGFAAVKMQNSGEENPRAIGEMRFLVPPEFSKVNPEEQTKNSDFIRRLLANAVLVVIAVFFELCVSRVTIRKKYRAHISPVRDKVVLIE